MHFVQPEQMQGFVAAGDEAIAEAEALRGRFIESGLDRKVELMTRIIDFLVGRRNGIAEGTLDIPPTAAFGVSRFVGDYDWGPEAQGFVDAAYAFERYWERNRTREES